MKKLALAGAFALAATSAIAEGQTHYLAIHVDQNDPQVMNMALNNAQNVEAYYKSQGDSVVITWDEIWMTEDDFRGYLIEAQVCQNGFFIDVAYHSDKSPITILDERTCQQESNGKLYAVEKHGYTDPITIPWP